MVERYAEYAPWRSFAYKRFLTERVGHGVQHYSKDVHNEFMQRIEVIHSNSDIYDQSSGYLDLIPQFLSGARNIVF